MRKNDRCAIGRCNNSRYNKENYVIKPHIAAFDGSLELRFWKCTDPKLYAKWTFNCNRKTFKVNKHIVVCSNHFKYGRPTNPSPIATLYLREYESDIKEIKPPRRVLKRVVNWETSAKPCKKRKENILHTAESTSTSSQSAVLQESKDSDTNMSQCNMPIPDSVPCLPQNNVDSINSTDVGNENATLSSMQPVENKAFSSTSFSKQNEAKSSSTMSWNMIKGKKRHVKFYTGCPTADIFMFIVDHVRPKHSKLLYYRGSTSNTNKTKKYQISPVTQFSQKKPGKPRKLSLENEILITLMRIHLYAPVEGLAFRFGISSAHASNIITTFIVFL